MRCVIIESPFKDTDPAVFARNVDYARACLADCLRRGEAPFASHMLYTQPGVLDDNDPVERAQGINAGLALGARMDATVVYEDRGVSKGMRYGIDRAHEDERPVERRCLGTEWAKKI